MSINLNGKIFFFQLFGAETGYTGNKWCPPPWRISLPGKTFFMVKRDCMSVHVLQIVSQIWTIWYWSWWFGFRLEPISTTAPAASKMTFTVEATQKYSFCFISLNPWHAVYLSVKSFIKFVDSTSLNSIYVIATAKITIGLSGYGRTQLWLGVRTGLSPKQSTPTTLEQVSLNASILWHL
jgi:hypothetical protein